ncbi:MAG: sigma-54-dependent Fis family transcriptional regulator [Deltaproteobacteria bacterium]|nr:sigma-54-dependent Fis family transcriptional regulator [Deltaproteobacteria bacterium]
MKYKILIVEDNQKLASLFQEALGDEYDTHLVFNLKQAKACLDGIHGLLLDLQLPDGEGLSLIKPARQINPSCAIIVVTAYGTIQKAVEALNLGATDFLEKPVDLEALVQRFYDLFPLQGIKDLVAESAKMVEILQMADRVASTPFPVLITGETGTGKDVLARYIHRQSGRGKFIGLNCASVPHELADSMLFGHLRGSFTGAIETRKGLLSAIKEGTLFLDEIGELPLSLQPKLLRFLDSGCYLPLGSSQESKSDIRIIAATNKDLKKAVKEGSFRKDLHFRLTTFPIHIPSLRERKDDIIPLLNHHLERAEQMLGRRVCLSDSAKELLLGYCFPGNVRELFNLLDRTALLTGGNITDDSLRSFLSPFPEDEPVPGDFWSESKGHVLKREKELIDAALAATGGNKAAAARTLKVSYKTLFNKMKKLGL